MSAIQAGHDKIQPEAVAKAARLARIAVPPDALPDLAEQLEQIRAWAVMLQEVDVSDVEPMIHPHSGSMRLRDDDVTGATLSADEALASAPAQKERHFLVPRMVG